MINQTSNKKSRGFTNIFLHLHPAFVKEDAEWKNVKPDMKFLDDDVFVPNEARQLLIQAFDKGADGFVNSVLEVPGLIWKIWVLNQQEKLTGGFICSSQLGQGW